MKQTQLTRSTGNKMVSGVAAGLANYLNIDPVFVRLFFVLFTLSHLPLGVLTYIILALLLPADHLPTEAIYNGFSEDEIVIKDS